MHDHFICLGIESSCDDTAAAVVAHNGGAYRIDASIVYDQSALHKNYGGVVPEIAARAHAEKLDICVSEAIQKAGVRLQDIDLVAVSAGPGLIGGVLCGVMCAKGLAAGLGKPIIGVNHLAGHALTPCLTDGIEFPFLMLLVSGGHCQFLIVKGPCDYQRLGSTIDDAPGEAFDKTARILGLGQPGGPCVEKRAKDGDPTRFDLPRPLLNRPDMDVSFSGLKTAVLRSAQSCMKADNSIAAQDVADLCAGFQEAVSDVLTEKTRRALMQYLTLKPTLPTLAVAGGVAANGVLRAALQNLCKKQSIRFIAPPLALCTDNAAMIAYAGAVQYQQGRRDDLTLAARPRWPLDTRPLAGFGTGKKGPKA